MQDTTTTEGPPRPPVELLRTTRIEPPATVTVTPTVATAEHAAAAAAPRPASDVERSGPRPAAAPEPIRTAATGARSAPAAPPATPRAAASIEPPTVSPPLDLTALARTSEGQVETTGAERHWTFGSSFRLARTAAQSTTSRVLEWKQRVTSSIGSLLDVLH